MPLRNAPIDNMLAIGAVTPRSARIWLRVREPGELTLRWRPQAGGSGPAGTGASEAAVAPKISVSVPADNSADNTTSVLLDNGLEPETAYRVVALDAAGHEIAHGHFRTAPADAAQTPSRFGIALLSCHQPFADDGELTANAEPMLEAVTQCLEQHNVRQVMMAGDQCYADKPKSLSLFEPRHFNEVAPSGRESVLDCTAEEVRRIFHHRYRHFWNLDGWKRIVSNYPCYPILDDHEIVDNWGSDPAHKTSQWQPFGEGAFKAYQDYQATWTDAPREALPHAFDYEVEFGEVATYVLDLRSNRQVGEDARVISSRQMQDLEQFLERNGEKQVLFVVLSVPIVHLPRLLAKLASWITPRGEDFSDRWVSAGQRGDRDAVLRLLRTHQRRYPSQRIVLLSGDIHIGCVHQLRWRDGSPHLYQFISSGVTNDVGKVMQTLVSWSIRLKRRVTLNKDLLATASMRPVPGERGFRRNPCGALNVGIVELTRDVPNAPLMLQFLLYSHSGPEPLCLYRSPRLPVSEPA